VFKEENFFLFNSTTLALYLGFLFQKPQRKMFAGPEHYQPYPPASEGHFEPQHLHHDQPFVRRLQSGHTLMAPAKLPPWGPPQPQQYQPMQMQQQYPPHFNRQEEEIVSLKKELAIAQDEIHRRERQLKDCRRSVANLEDKVKQEQRLVDVLMDKQNHPQTLLPSTHAVYVPINEAHPAYPTIEELNRPELSIANVKSRQTRLKFDLLHNDELWHQRKQARLRVQQQDILNSI
jgi:hypothetical protein